MSSDRPGRFRDDPTAGLLWPALSAQDRARRYYDLYAEMLGVLSGGSGLRNLGYRAGSERFDEAQAELCRRTVASLGEGRWLDVGCGEGGAACLLAAERPEVEITGLDLHPESIEAARRRAAAAGLEARVRFERGDACRMPFSGDGLFDGLYALETACHYPDKSAFASEARRVLKPGGRFALADFVMSERGTALPQRLVIRFVHQGIGMPWMHTATEWRGLLERAGFQGVRAADITPQTSACWDLWARRHHEVREELERRYPPALVAAVRANVDALAAGADAGQLRYALITARA
ncbi:MAG: class I SAM-dependent methyltransferase [Thermoanaerobaculia bacterium]|nr:class I SAM-dependent methyltransferase [Thermoanaerobaculia bacterium]